MTFSTATKNDYPAIAAMHTRSWQLHYRGDFSDHYLDHEAAADRLEVWKERCQNPPANQQIILAKGKENLLGFVCCVYKENPNYGSLLDNLHVNFENKGQGIGKALMQQAAKWLYEKDDKLGMYLWVLATNVGAIKFYTSLGGEIGEQALHEVPGVGEAVVYRVIWADLKLLLIGIV